MADDIRGPDSELWLIVIPMLAYGLSASDIGIATVNQIVIGSTVWTVHTAMSIVGFDVIAGSPPEGVGFIGALLLGLTVIQFAFLVPAIVIDIVFRVATAVVNLARVIIHDR